MHALFAKVNDQWRFEGFLSDHLFAAAGDDIENHVERENGEDTFFSVRLPGEDA